MNHASKADLKTRSLRPRGPALLRRLSLKHKLIAIIMLTCVASLMLVGTVFIAWEWTALRHALVRDVSAHAEILADNCKAALTFRDPADASSVLRSVGVIPSMVAACVYNAEGGLFAAYVRDDATVVPPRPSESPSAAVFEWDSLTVRKAIVLNDKRIGTVCLRADLGPIYLRLKRSILVIVCLVLLSSLAAYLISSRLQRIISAPILQLAEVARRVSEKKEYTVRAEPSGADEVGLLIQAFNEMLGQIQQRDMALVEANERLETRVQGRTAELTTANERLTKEITAHRQTDQALAAANEQLAETVQSLRRSNKELQDFAYVTAHDLKAPLRGIGTLADWIASDYADKFDDQGRQQLRLLKGRATRLAELINGILHYSEIGRGVQHPEAADLSEVIRDAISLLDPPPQIQVVVADGLPSFVVCEKVRLGQVFHNLIDNAIKFMDKPQGRIEIRCRDQGRAWEFAVSDNGPGIDKRYFEKIFQMFQTLAPRDQRESTGIGLAIVKKIVELYGGNVWVESEVGKGSTFFFTFPKTSEAEALEYLAVLGPCEQAEEATRETRGPL